MPEYEKMNECPAIKYALSVSTTYLDKVVRDHIAHSPALVLNRAAHRGEQIVLGLFVIKHFSNRN